MGDKEGLYQHVLEEAYSKVRGGESNLALDHLDPMAALDALCRYTFEHHRRNPAFIRMVMIENIHHGRHVQMSKTIRSLNRPAIAALEAVLKRGQESGVFVKGSRHWSSTGRSVRCLLQRLQRSDLLLHLRRRPFHTASAANAGPPRG